VWTWDFSYRIRLSLHQIPLYPLHSWTHRKSCRSSYTTAAMVNLWAHLRSELTRYWPRLKPPLDTWLSGGSCGPIHCWWQMLILLTNWPRPTIFVPMLVWGSNKRKEMTHATHVALCLHSVSCSLCLARTRLSPLCSCHLPTLALTTLHAQGMEQRMRRERWRANCKHVGC